MIIKNKVYPGDCLKLMKQIEDKSIDFIPCDLPYGKTQNKWDSIIDLKLLWEQYERIIKDKGVIALTCSEPFTSMLVMSNPKLFRYDLIWEKNKSTGFLNAKKMPLRSHESILIFYKNLPIYNPQKTKGHKPVNSFTKNTSDGSNYGKTKLGVSGGGQTDRYPKSILRFKVVNNDNSKGDKYHPTQKPEELGRWLIRTFTNEGDLILDNACGSGSFLVSAVKEKRDFIGFEFENKYVKIARKRIMEAKEQLTLLK